MLQVDNITVECKKLFDGKISICIQGEEVFILPSKVDCDVSDITEAIEAVVAELTSCGTW